MSLPRRPYVTTRTLNVFIRALRLAEKLCHDDVTPVHVALSLLDEEASVAVSALLNRRVPLDVVKKDFEAHLPPIGTPRSPAAELHWTSGLDRIYEGAVAEARELDTEFFATEHVLLALVRDQTGKASKVFARHGFGYADARTEVLQIRNTVHE